MGLHPRINATVGDPDTAVRFMHNGRVNVRDTGHLDFANNAPFSVELWINPSQPPPDAGYPRYISKEGATGYVLQAAPDGKLGFSVYALREDAGISDAGANDTVFVPLGQSGTFSHVVAIYDGTAIEVFVNGQSEQRMEGVVMLRPEAVNLAIGGASYDSEESDCLATIDEVAIYDHVLKPDRISAHLMAAR